MSHYRPIFAEPISSLHSALFRCHQEILVASDRDANEHVMYVLVTRYAYLYYAYNQAVSLFLDGRYMASDYIANLALTL